MKSDVYFAKLRTNDPKEKASALARLIDQTGLVPEYKKDEIVPVKITIGDSQCVYNLRPEMVKAIITALKKRKTRPFIFDTNVIYTGERLNAVDHLTLANNKGFAHSRVGAPFIIADGVFGHDGKEHQIESDHIDKVRLPSFVGMMDSLVVLSHITGHILAGYAGAIKNVAMGMSCKASKQVQHSSLKPSVVKDKCTACGCCVDMCPVSAISLKNDKALIDQNRCVGCGECLSACKFDAILVNWGEDILIFYKRMVEVAGLILSKFKNKLFVNFAFDITKECDCISNKNEKIITHDLGILASTDAVSLDKATIDLINKDDDVFLKEQGKSGYRKVLEYASQKGLGSIDYNLKTI
ncbi:MAG: DUF362 domain-containing protein [Candidatus Omnitrophica bacterium]|nr:DUF362 domain-containing protein [Candidatus Omnitrophota bacterium]